MAHPMMERRLTRIEGGQDRRPVFKTVYRPVGMSDADFDALLTETKADLPPDACIIIVRFRAPGMAERDD